MNFLEKIAHCIFVWHIRPSTDEELKKADVIISHAASDYADGRPGKINEYLASIVLALHEKTGLPVIAQGEVALCLISKVPLYGKIPCQRELPQGDYLDSVGVAQMQKKICNENGWKHPILVTCRPHMLRALLVSEKAGMDVLIADVPKAVYDWRVRHWWMRNWWLNNLRELPCRIVWLLQGKI